MAEYTATGPDGREFTIEGPEGATKAQIIDAVRKQKYTSAAEGASTRPVSTVTGQPVPTGEEYKAGADQFIKTAGPILGDVAFTMAVPELSVPLKAGRLAKFGISAANTAIRALASGAGSGVGSLAADAVTGGKMDLGRAGEQALLGAGGEIGMTGLGAGVKYITGKTKPIFESIPDFTASGTLIKKFYNNRFKKEAADRSQKFLMDVAPDSIKKMATGTDSVEVLLNEAFADNSVIYGLYKNAVDTAAEKEGGKVVMDDTAQLVGNLMEAAKTKLGPDASQQQVLTEAFRQFNYTPTVKNALAELTNADMINPARVEYLMAEIYKNKGWGKLNPTQKEARDVLKETILSDLDKIASDNLGGLTAGGIKKTADEEYKALIKFNTIRKIYNTATTKNADTGVRMIHPDQLYESIFASKKKILNDPALAPLWPALEKEARAAQLVAQRINASNVSEGLGSVAKSGAGMAAGGLVGGTAGATIAEGIGAASAWALLSPSERSTLKRIFNFGANVEKATKAGRKTILHVGGEAVGIGKPQAYINITEPLGNKDGKTK